ncbi:T6SS phospholipase effector Tle1-like catalytic domain-containing protein [Vibrio cyclitrophicus]|uniref:T6SS phospholipase effector Tle1-like catalytic domain-containing protein n=1 Tax=Vibrio cyclitrophicus TaxID=47951 RepID=UPI000C8408F4|nr:DUF2235 domain-containing protein [Vibrio cyclitrophicus]PMI08910.1 hypothetical protein BCU52_12620 [Vibrio cyclitrophicus]
MIKKLVLMAFTLVLAGCSTPKPVIYKYDQNTNGGQVSNCGEECGPKKLVVFFDGTANDETSRTNVKELESLLHLYAKGDYSSFYIEGVGVGGKIIGGTTGWGAAYRIKLAYQFLIDNYDPSDHIYIFGFSRGAYQARILNSMIRFGGLPDIEQLTISSSEVSDRIYSSYKGKFDDDLERSNAVNKTLLDMGILKRDYDKPIRVEVLGLWDTVEAYGWLDGEDNVDEPNIRYGDQLCNVNNSFHALSLDDNRATVFTPLLQSREYLMNDCTEEQRSALNMKEVWFSGAHSDVGGGYNESRLNASSLRWMLSELTSPHNFSNEAVLFPSYVSNINTSVLDVSHNPRSTWYFKLAYKDQQRAPSSYAANSDSTNNQIYIHQSVFDRLKLCAGEERCRFSYEHELDLSSEFHKCFAYNKERGQFDVISDLKLCNIKVVDW